MEQEENQESNSPLPVLPRLERLDRLLQLLEEKQSLSGRHSSNPMVREMEQEDQLKSLSSALEEVHNKGTLMERLALLENRVLQLSLEIDEGNTSRTSSSNVLVSENSGHTGEPKVPRQDDIVTPHQGRDDPHSIQEDTSTEACTSIPTDGHSCRRQKRKAYTKMVWVASNGMLAFVWIKFIDL